jgi:hypothetical protein
MKLYSEKEIVRAIQLTVFEKPETYLEVINKLTPIELPTWEEVNKQSEIFNLTTSRDIFFVGAKWVIEQIKQQDNGMEINN